MPKSEFDSELFVVADRVQASGPFHPDLRLAAGGDVEVIVWRVRQGEHIARNHVTVTEALDAARRERPKAAESSWWDMEPMGDPAVDPGPPRWRDGPATASSVVVGLTDAGASLYSWTVPVTLRVL
jgi:hypothetical protein